MTGGILEVDRPDAVVDVLEVNGMADIRKQNIRVKKLAD